MKCPICGVAMENIEEHLKGHINFERKLLKEELDSLKNMDRFMLYNVMGKTIVVNTKIDKPFTFHCSAENCGIDIKLEGTIKVTDFKDYIVTKAIALSKIESFKELLKSSLDDKPLVFEGYVNGKKVKLPAESTEDFSRRFLSMKDSYYVLR